MIFRIIETLVREVHLVALHLLLVELSVNHSGLVVVDEVVVDLAVVIEELDGYSVIGDEAACDERIWEALNRHGIIVKTQVFIDIKVFLKTLGLRSSNFGEDSEVEFTIVDEHDGVLGTSGVLLNFFGPDIAVAFAADHFFKCLFIRFKIVHSNPPFPIVFLGHKNGSSGVIGYDTGDDGVHSWHTFVLHEIVKLILIVFKLNIGFQIISSFFIIIFFRFFFVIATS